MMEEVPFVYPNNSGAARRFVVDVLLKQLVRSDEDGVVPETSSQLFHDHSSVFVEQIMAEAASVSAVTLRGKDALVTTSALADNPSILSVSLSWETDPDEIGSPKIIDLDVGGIDQRVVAIHAFAADAEASHPEHNAALDASPALFHFVLVGNRGTIVSFMLDSDLDAKTNASIKVTAPDDYIPGVMQTHAVTSSVRPKMVTFLPCKQHYAIISMTPWVLTVDWMGSGHCAVWSETQCKEAMEARFLHNFFSLFQGNGAMMIDMPSTAALCVSSNTVPGSDTAYLIFTLHSDASIRAWKIDPEISMSPMEVIALDTTDLEPSSSWSDAINSISMCSRMYGERFTLAIAIKTCTSRESRSNCNIWALHGELSSIYNDVPRRLNVPPDAFNVVDMAFKPTQRRCSLSVVFEGRSGRFEGDGSLIVVCYPPSSVHIVSSMPETVQLGSLDSIASVERNRIRALSYGRSGLLGLAEKDPFPSIEEALNRLDSLYLKFLFRPMFPRGNGSALPPSYRSIRKALSKLVRGAPKEHGISIELETIKTLYEWRKRDKMQNKVATIGCGEGVDEDFSSKPETLSVYEYYTRDTLSNPLLDIAIEECTEEEEPFQSRLGLEVEAHEKRWIRLLDHIWEEEKMLRRPLFVFWMDKISYQVIVRGGVITVLHACTKNKHRALMPELDVASQQMVSCVAADPEKARILYALEARVSICVAGALLDQCLKNDMEEEMALLGRWAANKVGDDSGHFDQISLKTKLSRTDARDIIAWVAENPVDKYVDDHKRNTRPTSKTQAAQLVANTQMRHATCSQIVRAVDSIRRSRFGKCLLLYSLGGEVNVADAAFRAYLNAISVLWVLTQRQSISKKASRCEESLVPCHAFPAICLQPKQRLSAVDPNGILGPSHNTTTVLDLIVIEITKKWTRSATRCALPSSVVLHLSAMFMDLFSPVEPRDDRSFLPELSILPKAQGRSVVYDYPNLALRLLAPYLRIPLLEDDPWRAHARHEATALCLLAVSESSTCSSQQKSKMHKIAFDLINQDINALEGEIFGYETLKVGVEYLKTFIHREKPVVDLKILLSFFLPEASDVEIERMAQSSYTSTVFSCVHVLREEDRFLLGNVARFSLHIFRMLRGLDILEKFIGPKMTDDVAVRDEYVSRLLDNIRTAIDVMQQVQYHVPIMFDYSQYKSLWVRKFKYARIAGKWSEAYSACFEESVSTSQKSLLEILVKDMVDRGALEELIQLCKTTEINLCHEACNLHPVACDVLLFYSKYQNNYQSGASSQYAADPVDYQGSLYALYASQREWKRAAQAMDLRYLHAAQCLEQKNEESLLANELRECLILNDLVLAACGVCITMMLVNDPFDRFFVSGNYEKSSNLVPANLVSSVKTWTYTNDSEEDRLDKFTGMKLMDAKAVRSIGLRTLFADGTSDQPFVKKAVAREFESSSDDFEELFTYGYFPFGLLLAKAWAQHYGTLNGSTKPCGEDLFGGLLIAFLTNALVPQWFAGREGSRPTLRQLHVANDYFGIPQNTATYYLPGRSTNLAMLQEEAVKAATLDFIRKLTLIFSSAETPVAVQVARSILDQKPSARLPAWLERVLSGADTIESNGAFAPRPRPGCLEYLGDPRALLDMYTRRGFFVDACALVVDILSRHINRLEKKTGGASRLPHKGHVDFLPHKSLSMLYSLIEIAAVQNNVYEDRERVEVLRARNEMVGVIRTYFRMTELGEAGIRSSRLG